MMKIALAQFENSDMESNFLKIIKLACAAAENGCDAVAFCEAALTGYTLDQDNICTIIPEGEQIKKLSDFAAEKKINLLFGANVKQEGKTYNSYFLLGKNNRRFRYDKIHLGIKEKKVYQAGEKLAGFDTGDIKIGVALCIESHIPELFSAYAESGVSLVLVPSAAPAVCGDRQKIWRKYLPTRAYDNGMYVAAVNMEGQNAACHIFLGGMTAIDPKGEIIGEDYSGQEKLLIFALEKEKTQEKRFLSYKRHGLYTRGINQSEI